MTLTQNPAPFTAGGTEGGSYPLGFVTGQPVIVTAENGCLVIRAELNG